jgi:hypothetical protein
MSILLALLLAALAAGLIWLIPQSLGAAAGRKAARAAYFSRIAPLLQDAQTQIQPTGFARLAGQHGGHSFDLQAVPDTLTFRKLPTLWVLVTLTEPVAVRGEMHIMARPTQTEVFSHFALMSEAVALPAGFPEDCALRCDDAGLLPPQDVIAGLASWFHDPKVKEVVISPKGVRLVFLAEEAERGGYLLFRNAEMGREALDPARVLPHLDALAVLRDDLNKAKER